MSIRDQLRRVLHVSSPRACNVQQMGVFVQQAMQQPCNMASQMPYFNGSNGMLHATGHATAVQKSCCIEGSKLHAHATPIARQDGSLWTTDEQAADLREHFEERAAILEYDAGLPRAKAEREAAKMTATLARNRGYTWAALRLAFRDYPPILAEIPDRLGVVDCLPLGVAKLAIHPRHGVMPQGRHEGAA